MGIFSKTTVDSVASLKHRLEDQPEPFDVNIIEDDIAEAISTVRQLRPIDYAPPAVRATVGDIGTLSAEAVASQFEGAAKAIELMGDDLMDCVRRAEAMASDCKEAIAYVQETAEKYREEAKLIRDRIEHATNLTTEVRVACDEMRKKIEQPRE